VKTADLWDIMP